MRRAGSDALYRGGFVVLPGSPRSAIACTTWLPVLQPRSAVQAPIERAPSDLLPCSRYRMPQADSVEVCVQLALPTPRPSGSRGSSFANLDSSLSTSKGAVEPGCRSTGFPLDAGFPTVRTTPLSTAV